MLNNKMGTFTALELSNKVGNFIIEDIDLSIVNSLRRIIISEVPNVAFAFEPYSDNNGITVHKNTCALHNEILGHRISLIPLCFDADEIENFEPKKYRFVLSKKNVSQEILNVTTNDFDIYDENNVKYDAAFKKKIFPADPITKEHILITRLKPNMYDISKGEEIDIECYASVNTAKEHARWNPVSKCSFYNVVDENITKQMEKTLKPEEKNTFNCLDKYRYFKKNQYDEANQFHFSIESECRLTPKYLFGKAIEILISQINNFQNSLDDIDIVNINDMNVINIMGSSHTLLNVLQSLIYNENFRNKPPNQNPLEFIGYHQSHPLDNKMVLKIKFKENNQNVRVFLKAECARIVAYLAKLKDKWNTV